MTRLSKFWYIGYINGECFLSITLYIFITENIGKLYLDAITLMIGIIPKRRGTNVLEQNRAEIFMSYA